mgnify:FL=1
MEINELIFVFPDIQEFYELTLLDDTKSIQQKTAETIRIANKWEANEGPITTPFKNDVVSFFFLFFLFLSIVLEKREEEEFSMAGAFKKRIFFLN